MWIVVKPFVTAVQRFRAGDVVSPEYRLPPALFERLVALGHLTPDHTVASPASPPEVAVQS